MYSRHNKSIIHRLAFYNIAAFKYDRIITKVELLEILGKIND